LSWSFSRENGPTDNGLFAGRLLLHFGFSPAVGRCEVRVLHRSQVPTNWTTLMLIWVSQESRDTPVDQ
jgi:hypothetical protein